jgi:short-subunit dehydrogenase
MMLEKKNAVIYGASGAVGSAVAYAFAAHGARVFLAGRTHAALERVAEKIQATGDAQTTAHSR